MFVTISQSERRLRTTASIHSTWKKYLSYGESNLIKKQTLPSALNLSYSPSSDDEDTDEVSQQILNPPTN